MSPPEKVDSLGLSYFYWSVPVSSIYDGLSNHSNSEYDTDLIDLQLS